MIDLIDTTIVVTEMGYDDKKNELWFKWENKRYALKGKHILEEGKVDYGDLLEARIEKRRNIIGKVVYEILNFRVIDSI